jgi:hypothetical protein
MLYQKMEENSNLHRKFESAQLQQVVFLSQMMQSQNSNGGSSSPTSSAPVAAGLMNLSGGPTNPLQNAASLGLP